MHRSARLFIFALSFALASLGCGVPPEEDVAAEQSALNGHSIAPAAYSWNSYSQPWTCAPAQGTHPQWLPMTNPWPMNTQNSWCQWMPATSTSLLPWNVDECWSGGTPSGAVDIYSNTDYTGSCARLFGLGAPIYGVGHMAPFLWDADLMEVNGWHSTWTPPGGTPQFAGVKSMIIGPQTDVVLCAGPFTGPVGSPCNAYTSQGIHIGPIQIGYPNMIQSNGLFFETAAIKINANAL